jgi:hypothetical protein
VDRGLALIAAGARLVSGARLYALSDGEVRGAVAGAAGVLARVEAAFLDLVAALDSRPGAVPGTRPGQGAAAFLHQVVLRSPGQAFRDVAAARMLDRCGAAGGGPDGGDGVGVVDGVAGADGVVATGAAAGAEAGAEEGGGGSEDGGPDGAGDGSSGVAPGGGVVGDGTVGSGGLPVMVAAFRSGQVSRPHLDVAVRTLSKVPAQSVGSNSTRRPAPA